MMGETIGPRLSWPCLTAISKECDMKAMKNLGKVSRYVDPSMPVWLQVIIGFFLGVVVGYCWHYNAVGGCL